MTSNECPHCGEEDPRHHPEDCRDNPWFEMDEEDEAEFRADEAMREFDARLKKLTHGLYERVPCERGIVLAMADKGDWFRCLADAEAWLKGWQV